MDTGKVNVVLNALREELQTRRTTGAQSTAGAADDGPVLPAAGAGGADADSGRSGGRDPRQHAESTPTGVLVELSSEACPSASGSTLLPTTVAQEEPEGASGAELSQRPIPEFVVPFFVPQEPLVVVAPYVLRAVVAAIVAGLLMLLLL
jgi:hypothetical protein